MSIATIRCACPHCGGRLGVKETFAGRRIKCPKCQEPFVVEAPDEEAEAPAVSARKPTRTRADEEERLQETPRKKKPRAEAEDEDEVEDRPRKKKKKKQKASGDFPWILVGGGVALVAVIAIVLVVVLKKSDSGKKGKDGSDTAAKKPEDQPGKKPEDEKPAEKNPDLLVNVNLQWLEPPALGGVNLAANSAVTFHIVLVGDSYKKSKTAVGEVEKLIKDKLLALAGPGVGQVGVSDEGPDGNSRMISLRLGPIQEGAEAFANKINFGTVRGVENGVITLVVRKEALSPAPAAPDMPMGTTPMPMPMPMPDRPMPGKSVPAMPISP